ncbi:penicillin-binding transpeptidase domain-containing protein [Streptomyces sp. JJ66]|uniref:penicillin-binding transpeptidase domain-containing protein n=1 Tax=Streptomyces sp. JJ66 TaxID=2803843 RepID=UPI00214BAA93|nr:penicillin-binding transpeptidase domain-containing protein [Streptomyces sp. JJ66]
MAVIGAVCAVAVGTAGFGAYALVDQDEAGSPGGSRPASAADDSKPGPAATGPLSAGEVRGAAEEFLAAWESGDAAGAAARTDAESAARKALAAFAEDGGVTGVQLTERASQQDEVPFEVTAEVEQGEATGTLEYVSTLTVVREQDTGKPVVHWEPAVLHPDLAEGDQLVTDAQGDPEVITVDRDGNELSAEDFPELKSVLADITKRYAEKSGGTAPLATRIVDAQGKDKKVLAQHTEGTPGEIPTTLDAGLQRAAQAAVEKKGKGSAVAVKPSTGEVLAVAALPVQSFNPALRGSYAPGSTWKVVSASLLIEKNLASADAPHPCPQYFEYGGWKFQNLDEFEIQGGTFRQSFARSCNTAFISQAPELADDDLTQQARDLFGLGLTWQVGAGTFDGSVPVQSNAQMAASLIGQGGVRMNPLNMASVAATVKNGGFKQPHLVPPTVDDRTLATAPRAMSPALAQELRSLMNTTATAPYGTATQAMASVGGDKGGKTGSAEVDGQELPNAWFIGYSDDLAAAAVIPASGHGGTNAGPVVAEILNAG